MRRIMQFVASLAVVAAVHGVEFMPGDVRWSVQLDVRALEAGGVLDACRDAKTWPQEVADLMALEALAGLRVDRDIDTIIACGVDALPQTNLIIVRGRFDAAKLVAVAQTMPGYKALAGEGPAIHQWTSRKKRPLLACLARDDVMLLAGSVERIRAALATPAPAAPPAANPKPFLLAGSARDLEDWDGLESSAKELAHIERSSARVVLGTAELQLTARVHLGSWVRAKQLSLLASGGLRIIRMVGKLDPALLTALDGATISQTGSDLDIALKLPLKDAQRLALAYLDKEVKRIVAR